MKNLLVIDKSKRNIYKMKSFSKKYGLRVFEAHTGLEALNQLKHHDGIDIVLIDVNLDNEDGFDLVEKIRDTYNTLPIIILTTLNSKKDFVHGLKVGASDYLLKPFNEEAFVKRVMNPSKLRVTSSHGHIDTVDIKTLIHAELVKAQKGGYTITFGVAQYFNLKGENNIDIDAEYNNILTRFYPGLKSIFWETDFILRYGNQTFVFVLPFCGKTELPIVKEKLHTFSSNFFKHNHLNRYRMVSAFLSFPNKEEIDKQVMYKLIEEIHTLKHTELAKVQI